MDDMIKYENTGSIIDDVNITVRRSRHSSVD